MRERKLNRLSGYDYSTPGYYFVTICIKYIECLFGEIVNDKMELNEMGKIVEKCWMDLPNHYMNIELDEFVIMPNHFHGIIRIVWNGFKPFHTMPTKKLHGLPEIIRGFKTFSSRRINETKPILKFQWHKSYHDRIIRNDRELYRIQKYIVYNPKNWNRDKENQSSYRNCKERFETVPYVG